jgi:Tol biopolymer transport system component
MRSRTVTTLDGVESDPTLSPDGTQIAFIWKRALHVKPVNSGEPRRMLPTYSGRPGPPMANGLPRFATPISRDITH